MSIRVLCYIMVGFAVLAPTLCYAGGGAYFDNMLVKNDGLVIASFSFDDGRQGWQMLPGAEITPPRNPFLSPALYLNCHGRTSAGASYPLPIRDPGTVEFHAWVYLPKMAEQGDYHRKTISFAYLRIEPKTQSWSLCCGPQLRPGEDGYRIAIAWNHAQGKPTETVTDKPVLKPDTWALLSICLSRQSGLASASLDQKDLLSMRIDPAGFEQITRLGIQCWLGDRIDLPPQTR